MNSYSFILLAIVAIVAVIAGEPQEIGREVLMSDEKAMQKLENIFNNPQLIPKGVDRNYDFIPKVFFMSIDKKCVINKYKSHNLFNKISKLNLKTSDWALPDQWSFMSITLSCSNLYDAFVEFAFENTMTFNILWRALKNYPPMEEFTDMVTCANSYAVKNNFWNLDAYKN